MSAAPRLIALSVVLSLVAACGLEPPDATQSRLRRPGDLTLVDGADGGTGGLPADPDGKPGYPGTPGDKQPTGPDPDRPKPPLEAPAARYHSYEEVEDFLRVLSDRNPYHMQLGTYGTSSRGRDLYVVKLSDNVQRDEADEPKILINYSIHGDEIITVECAMAFLFRVAEGYETDGRIGALLDTYQIYVAPVVSPDSFEDRSREVDGVDPNREFPYDGNPDRNSIGIIEAARALFESHHFAGTLDFHAFGELVLLPYGGSFSRPSDYSTLSEVAGRLANVRGYQPVQISELFGELKFGGSVDYYHWRGGGISMAVELTTDKAPPPQSIPGVAEDAAEMALRFVEAM